MQCYIHIPFCTSKCKYCRFASFSGISDLKIENYVQFLCKEIDLPPSPSPLKEKGKEQSLTFLEGDLEVDILQTLYFGGGTPSTLSTTQFERIFSSLKERFTFADDIEITIESTPEKVTLESLQAWEKLGVTRVSMGIQSLNEKTLYEVARYEKGNILKTFDVLETYSKQSDIVFNLDFIIGLPYVQKGELAKDISWILEAYTFPKHFSVYMLEDYYEVEEETDSRFEEITYPNPWNNLGISEEDFLGEYLQVSEVLEEYNIFSYEISNFSKKGCECKHNIGYWNHKEVVAFGLGASGFEKNIRYKNSEDFLKYYTKKGKTEECLDEEAIRIEKIMFGLRTFFLEKKYLDSKALEQLAYLQEEGLIEISEDSLKLTDEGLVKMDYVLSQII